MQPYQSEFIQMAMNCQVLQFGDFTLKSGRKSPYFFNAGQFNTGAALQQLGHCYAQTIREHQIEFDVLFGPAYKGIPVVSSTAIALSELSQQPVPFCFDRKEAKQHGEGGQTVGAPLQGKVLILDDVITAGTAIRHSLQLIQHAGAQVAGIVVAIDREERGESNRSAIQSLQDEFNIPVHSIIQFTSLIDYFAAKSLDQEMLTALKSYRDKYGCKID